MERFFIFYIFISKKCFINYYYIFFFFIYEKNNGNFRILVLDINKLINLFIYLLVKDIFLSFLFLIFLDCVFLGESIF